MSTYLLTWNPRHKGADGLPWLNRVVDHLRHARRMKDRWSTGTSRSIEPENRVFLLRQGKDAPGMIGSGWVTKGWFEKAHWVAEKAAKGIKANYIKVEWDCMVLPQHVLSRRKLLAGILPESLVNAQSSGREIRPPIASRLEAKWARHLDSISAGVGRVSWKSSDASRGGPSTDDSFDDLPGVDSSKFGSDDAPKKMHTVSGVKRDPRVRREVIKRSKRVCERSGCGEKRNYPGFIDVHHILGAAKSDRVWNCVALCPNCHREAHYAPDRYRINKQLLQFATQFK